MDRNVRPRKKQERLGGQLGRKGSQIVKQMKEQLKRRSSSQLQEGVNKVDFSWKGVSLDADSIRLEFGDSKAVTLLNVSYPPNENALV